MEQQNTIENSVASAILEKSIDNIDIEGVTYEIAPPSTATLILISELPGRNDTCVRRALMPIAPMFLGVSFTEKSSDTTLVFTVSSLLSSETTAPVNIFSVSKPISLTRVVRVTTGSPSSSATTKLWQPP